LDSTEFDQGRRCLTELEAQTAEPSVTFDHSKMKLVKFRNGIGVKADH